MATPIFQVTTDAKLKLVDHIDTIPWWLLDRLPQGFSGRAYARHILNHHPEYPPDPRNWSDEIVLAALSMYPIDAIGHFLVGEKDLDRYQTKGLGYPTVLMSELPTLAEQSRMICHTLISGEQPKFCCDLELRGSCIVKFSEEQRQADLLIAEHVALSVLNSAGIPASCSVLTRAGNYQFLVNNRFDCIGHLGRRGIVSLKSLDMEFVGSRDQRWHIIAKKLAEQNIIAESELHTIQKLFCFGRLIANSDMHSGNLSFFCDAGMPFVLTPVYDMLPMAYTDIDKQQAVVITMDTDLPDCVWHEAWLLALRFWNMLGEQADLSDAFRCISEEMIKYLQTGFYCRD